MLNYLRSEWYRILHGREIYLFTGVLCAIVLAANVILWAMAHTPNFPYATVRFSLSNLVSMMGLLFLMAATTARTARSRTRLRTASPAAGCSWGSASCPWCSA